MHSFLRKQNTVLRRSLCVYSTNFTRDEEMNHSPQLLAELRQSLVFDKLKMLGFKSACERRIASTTGLCRKTPILTTSWRANTERGPGNCLGPTQGRQSQTTTHAQKGLHYICMRGQVELAMTMNNKTAVSAAVSISSALRRLAG